MISPPLMAILFATQCRASELTFIHERLPSIGRFASLDAARGAKEAYRCFQLQCVIWSARQDDVVLDFEEDAFRSLMKDALRFDEDEISPFILRSFSEAASDDALVSTFVAWVGDAMNEGCSEKLAAAGIETLLAIKTCAECVAVDMDSGY